MDIEKAKKEFEKYTKKYDLEYPKMKRKYGHSFRVMENAKNIAKSLELSQEEVDLAELIGLLHDIGHFEEIKEKNILKHNTKIDHGDLGVEILEKSSYIREFIKEDKYDNIILKAVKNHNKFEIEQGLNERELLFTKIVRDADKLDIFYEGAEMFWNTDEQRKEINESKISEKIWNLFKEKKAIDRKILETPADGILNFIAFIFDMNFEYTCKKIKEADYINKILNKFDFKNKETAKLMEEVRKI